MLGVSRSTFYLELQSGRIPYTMVGRQRKFLEKDLKEYLRRNYVPAKKSLI
jgi:excisionase family DNA binding protein